MGSPGHDHHGLARADTGRDTVRRLAIALVLVGVFFVVELVAGLATNSLALLSDAGHMLTDVVGLGMALAAIVAARRHDADPTRTFGLYRLEILAALANAVLLFGVGVWILVEAARRFGEPPAVLSGPMLVVALLGLAVNVVSYLLLRGGDPDSLNVEGARLEVLADTLGSIGVVLAAGIIELTGFALADPLFGVLIGGFVLPRTWRLGRRALRVLLQAAPDRLDPATLVAELATLPGVASAHDLHVWTLTPGMEVASVHLRLAPDGDHHEVLDRARSLLRDRHGLEHTTVQLEPADHDACRDAGEVAW